MAFTIYIFNGKSISNMRRDADQIIFSIREQKLADFPEAISVDEAFDHAMRIEAIRSRIYAAANQPSLPGNEVSERYGAYAYADDLGALVAQLEIAAGLYMAEGPDLVTPKDYSASYPELPAA
jgi:hypothetical protein